MFRPRRDPMEHYELGKNITIHTHACGEGGIFVNAYLIETPNGVVAVDSTLSESESKTFERSAKRLASPCWPFRDTPPSRPCRRDHEPHRPGLAENHRDWPNRFSS